MDKQTKVFIIDREDISKTLIENYLKDVDFVASVGAFSEVEEVLDEISDNDNNILIVDVSNDSVDVLGKIKSILAEHKSCKIVAVSYNVSANFIVETLRSGAKEFLGKPLIKEEVIKAIKKAADIVDYDNNSESKGKVISAFSNKGGLGKTTVAVNLANQLAEIYKEKVVLVDLNMHLGDVTAFLDINPTYDIKYIVDNIDKADEDFLLSTLEQYKSSKFYVLADSPYRESSSEITTKDISNLLNTLKKTFAYVIVDISSNIDPKATTVFDESDLILFITVANLPTIRNCQRCLELFDKLGYSDEKVKIILNRFINSEDYKVEDIEAAINKKIFWKIPNNYFTVIEAVNKGITLQELNPNANVTDNYRQLTQVVQQLLSIYQP